MPTARKVALLKSGIKRHRASQTWYVNAVNKVENRPTNCITVDAEDGMYLAGHELIPTHNSSMITYAGSIQEILNDPDITIGVFSHTKAISEKFVAQVKREFEENNDLRKLYADICWLKPKTEAPMWSNKEFTVRRASNPKEATMEAHGLVDGQPTSKHFKLLLYDDVVTLESVSNPEQIARRPTHGSFRTISARASAGNG